MGIGGLRKRRELIPRFRKKKGFKREQKGSDDSAIERGE